MMAFKQKISIFVVLFIAFIFGFSFFIAANKDYFIGRDPAAVSGKLLHFNNMNSDQLRAELESKIKIKPVFTADNLPSKSIVFSGMSSQICNSYSEIHIEFSGEGMSVDGVATKMLVTAPCQAGQDPAEIAAIILPIQEILKQKPRDAEYSFSGFSGRYHFSSVTDSWPQVWVLRSVQFTNPTAGNPAEPGLNIASPRVVQFTKTATVESPPIVLEF